MSLGLPLGFKMFFPWRHLGRFSDAIIGFLDSVRLVGEMVPPRGWLVCLLGS